MTFSDSNGEADIIDWRPVWSGDALAYYQQLSMQKLPQISQFRSLREQLGLSQKDVAELLDTTQSNVSKIEARSDPTLSTLGKIVHGMGGKLRIIAEFDDKSIEMQG